MTTIRTGETEPIRAYAVDGDSAPLTGLTDLYVRIERASDGFLYDWNDDTFKASGWTTLNKLLAEVDATNLAGLYEVAGGFDTSAITNVTADDTYTIYALQTPGTNARIPSPASFSMGRWVDQVDDIHDKLPTNYIMGSAVQSDKDDDIDAILVDTNAILVDTNEMQGKLPTNNIMGSAVKTDKDDEIDAILSDTNAILVDTNEMQGKLPTNNIMGSAVKTDKDDEIDAILVDTNEMQTKLPTNYIMGSAVQSDKDDDIDAILVDTNAILVDTNEMQGKLPTNYIMGSAVQSDKDDDIDAILADTNEMQGKLPTNNIMGSAVKTDKDDEIDAILVDTNEMQGKLPTNYIMGSAVQSDKDDDIDAILVDTNEMQGKLPTNNIMGSSVKTDKDDEIAAILVDTNAILVDTNEMQGKLPTNYIMGSAVQSDKDDDIDAILVDTNEMQGKLPTNNIMGSAVKTGKDDEIDAILADTAVIQPLVSTNLDVTISSRAAPGDAMDLVTDAVDAAAMATSGANEIRDSILSDSTSFAGAAIDAAISTRAVAGDAMDLVTDAVNAGSLATTGADEIAASVWNALTATYAAVGSMGEAQGRLDAAITSRAAPGAAMTLTPTERGNTVDAIWDEPTAGHAGAGTTGKALTDASATADPNAIADAVWDEALAGHTAAGSAGQAQGRLDQTISSRAAPGDLMGLSTDAVTATALATSGVNEIRDSILSDSTPFQGTRIDAAVTSRAVPGDAMDLITDAVDAAALATSAVDEIVDQVWRETLTDHSGVVGSTAEGLSNAAASVSPGTIANAVWDELLSGHVLAGSAGEAMGRVDVAVSTRAVPGAAMNLVADAVDATALAASGVTEIQAAILSDGTPFPGTSIDTTVSSRAAPGADMGLTVAGIDAILDAALAGHSTLGTVGKALANVDAQVSTRAVPGDDMGLTSAGADLAADRVWDETLSAHTSTGSTGRKLSDLTVPPTVDAIADQVWDEALAGHAVAGSAGEAQANLDAAISTRAAPGDDMGATTAGVDAIADQVWRETLADHSGLGGSTAEALAQTSPATIGASVWDALLASHDTADTFGAAINACCAAASGASQVTINVQDLASAAVQGAQVDLFDATNTTFLSRHFTDVAGQITIAIDDGTYAVRIWASGYAFTVPETLTVSGDGSATFQGQSFLSPSAPSGPDKCVIFGQVLDAGGSPVVGAEVDAYSVTPQVGGGYIIGPQIASTITNTQGYFELELLRNIEVNFKIDDADVDVIKTVPDAPSQWFTTWA